MGVGDVLVAGERVADQHCVGARGVEAAVGLVGDLPGRERHAGVEGERLVAGEARDGARRLVGLAQGFGRDRCGIGHGGMRVRG
jgi:hypothetical protein